MGPGRLELNEMSSGSLYDDHTMYDIMSMAMGRAGGGKRRLISRLMFTEVAAADRLDSTHFVLAKWAENHGKERANASLLHIISVGVWPLSW